MKDLILSSVYYLKFEKVAKSVYYYWLERFKQPNKDEELIETIKSICEECGYIYIYRRVTQSLSSKGIKVDHKKVRKLMKELKLTCTKFTYRGRKYRSYKGNVGKIAKHLLKQRFNTDRPFQKVVTDITESKLNNGSKLYLSVYMDLYNSEIMSYSISSRPTLDMAINPLKEVLNICPNVNYRLTIHSDKVGIIKMRNT
ncbi:IS3 family transposase [Staphylococcus gallinarum]|uniref:IS3 family transposase n=1 Tax=Staphylococcus gallinarum TaxID=1293 RepID=UPI002DBCCF9D|nr:IS3 family transposase [Staphylococcus gallinarum]MEB6242779.1 IS3 family transposase [Staphylococcus gallinarum]MEB6295959.1 IS3 family transposase [Staphylococcus gallinarum]